MGDAAFTNVPALGLADYIAALKPKLDLAYRNALQGLLGPLELREAGSLMDCLDAGKKIRGCLLCLFCEVLGGHLDDAVPKAVALELVQSASLIHDDFVDQDFFRRGRPAVWRLVGARKAVLIGDILFASAIRTMTAARPEDGMAISSAIAELAFGAAMEPLDAADLSPSIGGAYERIISLKTGVLFALACKLGATTAGADKTRLERSKRYGVLVGEAYQITDDLHDLDDLVRAECVLPGQLNGLAPCIVHYSAPLWWELRRFRSDRRLKMTAPLLSRFRDVAALMKNDVEWRLNAAAEETSNILPPNGDIDLIRRAPRDLIDMFKA